MRVDRNAAAVVVHRQEAVGRQFDLDEGGVARQGLVHGVVDHLGEQVMERLLVGAADIHAGALAHRFQALQDLDARRRIAGFGVLHGLGCSLRDGAALRFRGSEQVVSRFAFGVRLQ